MRKVLNTLLLLLLCTTTVFAADVKLVASVSKSQVGVGEQFEIDYTITGAGSRFTPPDLSAFQVLSGPNISTSETIINGASSGSTTFSYILAATKEGSFTITAAAIVVNGHTVISSPLKIKVQGQAPPQANQPQQQAQAAPPDDDDLLDSSARAPGSVEASDLDFSESFSADLDEESDFSEELEPAFSVSFSESLPDSMATVLAFASESALA